MNLFSNNSDTDESDFDPFDGFDNLDLKNDNNYMLLELYKAKRKLPLIEEDVQGDPQGNLGRIINIASNHRNPSNQTCNNADLCQHIAVLKTS